ncbi:cytochrome P450 [Microbacterium esteraromaticum]|uniref:cytochrome P450 n=1 Tax=Microbacterium esteraromaticum TaxID=57043 RepID=UPI001C980818|nr:cytochrome P450 [Microbacterium esteraromaticum]MBY6061404.1 cytochrome P450 [Microbacterium esteraromaticum]
MSDAVRLTRHADVVAAARDAHTFRSCTSQHLHVPNGMDGDEHRAYRTVVDRQMTPQIVTALQPLFDTAAREIVTALPTGDVFDAVADLGEAFAVRAQCRWLGWPVEVEDELRAWMARNYAAARHPDPAVNARIAADFDALVRRQVDAHRAARTANPHVAADGTHRLLDERVHGRPLTDDEIVSILRNWTAGDLGSLARCVGVVVHRLATRPRWQQRMRVLSRRLRDEGADAVALRAEWDAILGECLRLDDPFVANRRVTTCPVTTSTGVRIDEGAMVLLDWTAANLDPEVFADRFDPAGHADDNLVFGTGPHVCPGRDLSYAELGAVIMALLDGSALIEPARDEHPIRHEPPLGGWARVPVSRR